MDSPFDYEDDSATGCGTATLDEATGTWSSSNPNCIQGWTKSACGEWSEVVEIKTKVSVRVRVRVRVKGRVRVRGSGLEDPN